MVFYDGEYLCVELNKNNYKAVWHIAKDSGNYNYIEKVNIVALPPTKKIARRLKDIGLTFDESAMVFFEKKKDPIELPEYLYPFQKESVTRLLTDPRDMLIADEMGLGKSVQAVAYLSMKPSALPALIVCPASLKKNWANELKKWAGLNSLILSGKSPYTIDSRQLVRTPVLIINYDILASEDKELKQKEMERRKRLREAGVPFRKTKIAVHGWCDVLSKLSLNTIICDEIQSIADEETIRARAVIQICKSVKSARRLFLSGTPYETKTSQFFTALSLLDPKQFSNKFAFMMRYCSPVRTHFGWKFDGASNIPELREKIEPIMIRRFKSEVLTQLPPKVRSIIPMEVTPAERKIYEEADKQFDERVANGDPAIGCLADLKKGAYLSKQNAVVRWVKEYLEFNDKLVLFVWHKSAYDYMMDTFRSYGVVGINGAVPSEKRQDIVNAFQNDDSVRLFVGQIQACNAGLTLTRASATAFAEFGRSWVQHEQAEDRVHRISQTADSVMAYYLVLENSIEEDIMSTLERRAHDMKLVLDGNEITTVFEDVSKEIVESYKNRKHSS